TIRHIPKIRLPNHPTQRVPRTHPAKETTRAATDPPTTNPRRVEQHLRPTRPGKVTSPERTTIRHIPKIRRPNNPTKRIPRTHPGEEVTRAATDPPITISR